MNTKKIKIFLPILILLILLTPIFVGAQAKEDPLVSADCGVIVNGKINRECGYADLLALVNRIINWIIMISVPIAAGVFAWAGFKYMTTGIADQKSEAKEMIQKVFIGFVVILSAWIIVNTITNTLLSDKGGFKEAVPVEGTNKSAGTTNKNN